MTKLIIIGVAVIVLFFILRFFVCKFFYRCQLLTEILKETTPEGTLKYSQGRVYLLLSILFYYITIGILNGKALKPNIEFDIKTLQVIIDALQWMILLMAGYVFGGKGLEIVKLFMNRNSNGNNNSSK